MFGRSAVVGTILIFPIAGALSAIGWHPASCWRRAAESLMPARRPA
jgi:hypothetical protein